ncbi:uncharacterized protein LOC127704503 [Mytilus californianus]|uniref:uncharacterized protein LOC127704503 n=1 Tax=Mytilus californianus TaxID=6549 RepID=UPI002247A1D3|nr:uncharacterized protein LOC127704503 [Mytilus californianus]
MCKTNICLGWKLDLNKLTLTCKISDIRLRVFIYDPSGNKQAVCIPPYPFDCEAYYENGNMSYNTITKEIQFIVHGETSQNIEGYWSCRHGTRRDISTVFVSMITTKGIIQSTTNSDSIIFFTERKKGKPSFAAHTWSSSSTKHYEIDFKQTSDLMTISEEFQSTQFVYTDMESGQTHTELAVIFNTFSGLFIGSAVLVLLMFAVCYIWISRRFKEIHLKTEVVDGTNPSNEAHKHAIALHDIDTDERSVRLSEYDSINENEMLPFPSGVAFDDKDSNSDRETITTIHSSKSGNTSSLENLYLEVIDDDSYLNPYQSIETDHDLEKVHNYSTISAMDYSEMCFQNPIELSPLEKISGHAIDVRIEHNCFCSLAHVEMSKFETDGINDLQDKGMLQTSSFHSEWSENKPGYSDKSTMDQDIDFEKASCSSKPDNNVFNDAGIFPCNPMSNLL